MHYVRIALVVIVLVVIAVFSIQNFSPVEVKFLNWSFNVPQFVLILGTYALGMVSGWGLVELVKRALRKFRPSRIDMDGSDLALERGILQFGVRRFTTCCRPLETRSVSEGDTYDELHRSLTLRYDAE